MACLISFHGLISFVAGLIRSLAGVLLIPESTGARIYNR
jgi:hypothetical protein